MANINPSNKENLVTADKVVSNDLDPGKTPWIRCLMQVLWPAFCGAAIAVGVLFSLIDPVQIEWVHVHLHDSREAAYTLGFIAFWILFATTNSFTWYLASSESRG